MFTRRVITDLSRTRPYLRIWESTLASGITARIHHILRPDSDRCQHDHPWGFFRYIIKGGYVEECGAEKQLVARRPGELDFCPPHFRHRILYLPRGGSWSLVITGPHVRPWGFYTAQGWMSCGDFVAAASKGAVLWCHDGSRVQPSAGLVNEQ